MKIYSMGESLIRYDFYNSEISNVFPTGTSINFLTNLNKFGFKNLNIITGLSSRVDSKIFLDKFKIENINFENSFFDSESSMGSYQLYREPHLYSWEVVYNRDNSVWQKDLVILKKLKFSSEDWLHLDGISLTVSNNSLKRTRKMISDFRNESKNIIFDFNLRKSLINSSEENILKLFEEVLKEVKVLNISKYDFIKWFGKNNDFKESLSHFSNRFKNIKYIFGTRKEIVQDQMKIEAFSFIDKKLEETKEILYRPKDLIGQGDSFLASIFSQILSNEKINLKKALEWSIFKLLYIGDSNVPEKKTFENSLLKKSIIR